MNTYRFCVICLISGKHTKAKEHILSTLRYYKQIVFLFIICAFYFICTHIRLVPGEVKKPLSINNGPPLLQK